MKHIRILFQIFFIVAWGATTAYAQEPSLSPGRKAAVDSLALEKVRDLSKYISIIGDKSTSFSEANRVIERTLELFAPDAQMGVSSLSSDKIRYYPIRQYLERLMRLNYKKVEIEWFDIQYISDLEPQPDGTFVGVITIYQRFVGTKEDGLKYQDTTKKDITVYVKRKYTQIQGRQIGFWDVLLGDIRVAETSR
ncbi:hypothetical protein BC781_105251 [Sediminitomix flava]|uniref:Uncharacterized protein n=2 Tax=Sediminitomix flava TaxID=379075 RepID=A0A315Z772_SEDFL|nr:hypothetical protein [Sediminitomix flava]PWJ40183.1 hypothetical protein BC781_105251 [Sediminitomix flava]